MDRQQLEQHVAVTRGLLVAAKQRMEEVEAEVGDDRLRTILSLVDHASDLFAEAAAPSFCGLTRAQVESLIACAEVGCEGCPDETTAKNAGVALERLVEFKRYHWRT